MSISRQLRPYIFFKKEKERKKKRRWQSDTMAQQPQWTKRRRLDTAHAKSKQLYKRKKGLFKKAAEFSLECESDILVALRIPRTGQIYIFDSSARTNWISILSDLVCHTELLPMLLLVIDKNRVAIFQIRSS